MTSHAIKKTLVLAAPPAAVWAHLTERDKLAVWFHRPDVDLSAPGPFTMPGADGAPLVWGEVTEARAPHRLAFSFSARPMGTLVTQVTWTLMALEQGTRLHLVHDGIPVGAEGFSIMTAFDGGWDDHLVRLRSASNPA